MEIQLKELIDRIKNDGVAAAEAEAASIVEKAKAEAENIVAAARAESEKILSNARAENDRMVKSGEDAIRQAGRNLLISFRESVAKELEAVIGENVGAAYSKENLVKLIPDVVAGWAKNPDAEDLSIIMGSEDLKELEGALFAALKQRISNGVTLKASDNIDGGFRIAVRDGGAYYDYSAETVVSMMSGYLNPRLTELLKEAE